MLLENKNALIYGSGRAIGGAVARAFAREGAYRPHAPERRSGWRRRSPPKEASPRRRRSNRLGIQPGRVDLARRDGWILGVRLPGTQDYYFPAWQFDREGQPLPVVRRVLRAAVEAQ